MFPPWFPLGNSYELLTGNLRVNHVDQFHFMLRLAICFEAPVGLGVFTDVMNRIVCTIIMIYCTTSL